VTAATTVLLGTAWMLLAAPPLEASSGTRSSLAVDAPVMQPAGEAEATSAAASPAPASPRPIGIEIDLSFLTETHSHHLRRSIVDAVDRVLTAEGYGLSTEVDRKLLIRVRLLDPVDLDYAIEFETYIDDQHTENRVDRLVCLMCPEVLVVEQIAEHLPRALDDLAEADVVVDVIPEPTAPVEAEIVALPPRVPPDRTPSLPSLPPKPVVHRRARWLGGVGITGILVATAGVSTTALGTIYINRGTERDIAPRDDSQLVFQDFERIGWILYGAGLATAAVGGAMIAIDVTTLHERRLSRLAARIDVAPSRAGLVLGGRF
jgi:hypothetical protein